MPAEKITSQFRQHKSLTLLVSLLLLIFIFPFVENSTVGTMIYVLLYTSTLLTGVYAISYDARYMAIGTLLAAPILVCTWSNVILESPAILVAGRISAVLFMVYTLSALLERIFSARTVGLNEIYASISAYILIGIIFAGIYMLIEAAAPGSFRPAFEGHTPDTASYLYFSFSALAGGGTDLAAVAPAARSLALLELLIGVVYIAVLLGRLISAMDLKAMDDPERIERHKKDKVLHSLLNTQTPFRERPVGLVLASVMFNFVMSVMMFHLKLPFFLDSWGTSLAVILGGWQAGVITAVLYNVLIAATYWGWSSWIWVLSSLTVAGMTWYFWRRGWVSVLRPGKLLLSGAATGLANSALVQVIIHFSNLPSYEGTLPVYRFFMKVTSNGTVAALAEKLSVELADKVISLMIAAVAVFLLRDLLENYKINAKSKHREV